MNNNILPVKLISDRVWRTYKGGKMIDMWKGKSIAKDTNFPEEWIGSLTKAINPGREHMTEGLSKVIINNKIISLYSLI